MQVHVSALRKALRPDDLVVRRGSGYALDVDPALIDALQFERLVEQAREARAAGRDGPAVRLFDEALALWRGPALAGLEQHAFAVREAERLADVRVQAEETRIELELALGTHAAAIPQLERLVAENPLRESLRALLMLALYRSGRQSDALAVYRDTRATLVDELGIEPSRRLHELEQAILRQDRDLDVAAPPKRFELPQPATPLVGRERELEDGADAFRSGCRLLTLTRPGGIGKTRLALELAQRLGGSLANGAAFVSLDTVVEPERVPAAIATSLGLDVDRPLAEQLRGLELLLVLDNFEQVVEAAPLVGELLAEVEQLCVVVTSRALLRIDAEQGLVVPPLARSDAAALFERRARAVGVTLGPEDAAVVAELCAQLEDLPLAIELAAARTTLLSPPALLERLSSRIELLVTGRRDAPTRQQTMRATIDWSFRLLDEDEQALLARLAVFAGGASVEAVTAVCGVDENVLLRELESLVANSLLRSTSEGEPRVLMLEVVREYALEQLTVSGEAEALRTRHAEHFASLVTESSNRARVDEQACFVILERDHDNFRAALRHVIASGDAESAARLVIGLSPFWRVRGHLAEARDWAERALAVQPPAALSLQSRLWNIGGILAAEQGEFEASRRSFERGLELARAEDDRLRVSVILGNFGNLAAFEDDFVEAMRMYREAAAINREIEDDGSGVVSSSLAVHLENYGIVSQSNGDLAEALEYLHEGVEVAERAGFDHVTAGAKRSYARALIESGRLDEAQSLLSESLESSIRLGEPSGIAHTFEVIAGLVATDGDLDAALVLLASARAMRREIGAEPHRDVSRWLEMVERDLSERLGDDRREVPPLPQPDAVLLAEKVLAARARA